MSPDLRRARDLGLLDGLDARPREAFTGTVWRVAREGRDPLLGSASNSRWCNGEFDVLYTCLERDGALAEIYALLSAQPVFPSKIRSFLHRLEISAEKVLRLADYKLLADFRVDVNHYREREYHQTQAIADAAYFLGYDGLIVPSARWACLNAVFFTDRIAPSEIQLAETEAEPIDWDQWRRSNRNRQTP